VVGYLIIAFPEIYC